MLPRRVSWLVAAIALAMAAPAHAATLGITGTSIVYQAASGEVNTPNTLFYPDRITIDTAGILTAGPGCVGSHLEVACPTAGITDVIVQMGDGDDVAAMPSSEGTKPGFQYHVQGGSGEDEISGTTRGRDVLSGGTGPDDIVGYGGKDELSGGNGNDQITGQGRVEGGPGNDNIFLDAGVGHQDVPSRVFGGGGNDLVNSRNRVRDEINCGSGRKDRTTADKRGDRISQNC